CLILEGFACRHQSTQEGRRQILSFYIPGDMPDLQALYLNVNDYSLGTLVPTKVALIGHRPMFDLFDGHPRLKDVFWRDTLIDAAVTRRWILNVGRREAYARAAHLLCELYVRHEVVGLAKDFSFGLPLTQTELG